MKLILREFSRLSPIHGIEVPFGSNPRDIKLILVFPITFSQNEIRFIRIIELSQDEISSHNPKTENRF